MKQAWILLDTALANPWQKITADEWNVNPHGNLVLKLLGADVAEFNRWVCVKWVEDITGSSNRIGQKGASA